MLSNNDDCSEQCPVRRAAEIIEGKWTTLIVRELLSGKKRYSEIQRALEGISPKMLSARLRLLEQSALVKRRVFDTIPPTTEYTLTDLGREMERVLQSMAEFGTSLLQQDRINPKAY